MEQPPLFELTSTNVVKRQACKYFLDQLIGQHRYLLHISTTDSGIAGGQPYGYDQTYLGCKHRCRGIRDAPNIISIENGFVDNDEGTEMVDVACIRVKIEGQWYTCWSEERPFPRELAGDTGALVAYFAEQGTSRLEQLQRAFDVLLFTIQRKCLFLK